MNEDEIHYWATKLEMIDDDLLEYRRKLIERNNTPLTEGDLQMICMHLYDQTAVVHHLLREVRRTKNRPWYIRFLTK